MLTSTSLRWLVVAVSAAMLLAVAAACAGETVEVPGETVVVEKEVIKEVQVPGETVVVEKEVVKTVEVPGETVTKEVVKTVEVPGETVIVEKEVVKTVEVPGETVVVEKTVAGPERIVQVPGETVYVQAEMMEGVPQYGGTLTWAEGWIWNWDPIDGAFGARQSSFYLETLGGPGWTADRVTSPMTSDFFPLDAMTGLLAESWEEPDPNTTIFHIRKAVHFQDKAPADGREMNAYDVEYSWHRLMGYPEKYGFTEPSSLAVDWSDLGLHSVEATDEWTVVFKHEPSVHLLSQFILYGSGGQIVNREAVEKFGDLKDWRNAVGTGPFILTEFVEGSSVTYEMNPNYWGSYEFNPRYQLPFVDTILWLNIQERPTKIAALRTGKLDLDIKVQVREWDSLVKTNPELKYRAFHKEGHAVGFPLDDPSKPWADINVRKAMQMAINRQEIAETLYLGLIPSDPAPLLGMDILEFITPFKDWPASLQEEHTYNPEMARELLAEAGYPDGFEAKFWYDSSGDQDAAQVPAFQSYFADVGIKLELVPMEMGIFWDLLHSDEFKEMTYDWSSFSYEPMAVIPRQLTSEGYMNWGGEWKDPVIAGLVDGILSAPDYDSYRRDVRELSQYYAQQHFKIYGVSLPAVVVWHPWVKGYNGERHMGAAGSAGIFARTWIDQSLKTAMGQ